MLDVKSKATPQPSLEKYVPPNRRLNFKPVLSPSEGFVEGSGDGSKFLTNHSTSGTPRDPASPMEPAARGDHSSPRQTVRRTPTRWSDAKAESTAISQPGSSNSSLEQSWETRSFDDLESSLEKDNRPTVMPIFREDSSSGFWTMSAPMGPCLPGPLSPPAHPSATTPPVVDSYGGNYTSYSNRLRIVEAQRSMLQGNRAETRNESWLARFNSRYMNLETPYIDTHCHIDFCFERAHFTGQTFKKFMEGRKETLPGNFMGCVTIFCNPATFQASGESCQIVF